MSSRMILQNSYIKKLPPLNFCFSVSFLPFLKKKKKKKKNSYIKLESHPLVHIYFVGNYVYWQRCYAFRYQIILNSKSCLGESYQTKELPTLMRSEP